MGAGHHSTSSRTGSRPSALHQGVMGGVRVPALARCGAEVGAPLFTGQGGEGYSVTGPSCSGQPRFQVIQDRLWSGQSACSRLLGSGAGQTLRPGHSSGALASGSSHEVQPGSCSLAGCGDTGVPWGGHGVLGEPEPVPAARCPLSVPTGVRAQAATCGRVPTAHGRALRVCALHCQPGQGGGP